METKMELEPFDIEKAKAGADIATEDWEPVRIICYDRIGDCPIVALVKSKDGNCENMYCFSKKGVAGSLVYGIKLKIVKIKKKVTKCGVVTNMSLDRMWGGNFIGMDVFTPEEFKAEYGSYPKKKYLEEGIHKEIEISYWE